MPSKIYLIRVTIQSLIYTCSYFSRYLLLLLLLAGDVEVNPGPVSIPCPRCSQTFNRRPRLDNHISKQQLLTCGHCKKNFCSEQQVRQHIQTEHFGSGNGADPPLQPPPDLSTPIFGLTRYEVQTMKLYKLKH